MNQYAKNILLESLVEGRENLFIKTYMEHGPTELMQKFNINKEEWEVIFDYLVFNYGLLYKIVINNLDFFTESYIENGFSHIRELLQVEKTKYDKICPPIFDLLAISNGGLRYHIIEHRDKYIEALRLHGGDFVRKVLYLWDKKYDKHWSEILDSLLSKFCCNYFDNQNFEKGLKLFSRMMTAHRKHRMPIRTELSKKGWV